MADAIDKLYDALDEADGSVRAAITILREQGVDIADDPNMRRLRRISEDIGNVRESVENYGFVENDDDIGE